MKFMESVKDKAIMAKEAFIKLSNAKTKDKNDALLLMAKALDNNRKKILEANNKDIVEAKKLLQKGELTESLVKRLEVTNSKIDEMITGIKDVAKLEDPVGKTLSAIELDSGLELYQVATPIGVIGMVFESRPDVVPQIISLALKSGNGVLLKGGREAANTNRAIYEVLTGSIKNKSIPKEAFQLLERREDVTEMLKLDKYIDLIIPRGSNDFVRFVQSNTKIPVLGHADGICHAYVDKKYDEKKALDVCFDAKVQYPAVCNAIETLLVHEKSAKKFLPKIAKMYKEAGVEIRCCPQSFEILKDFKVKKAKEKDWSTEYNDLIISIKVVTSLEDAVEHINKYGSHHTDVILTEDKKAGEYFLNFVDSSSVMLNASTRFADGFRYGKGAEIGISTGKIHARGPTGMEGMLIYKYKLIGSGHKVADYVGKNAKPFTHRKL
ncbi:MAG: gamma-glutamyl phosphate reductase [Candidatus Methanofastidiosum methylothiophilum]|uniref:Gamma-glutamyl phosphate reductase n=1 Tax=Candidatus Methanofastidiosum methylothiophilum TaxID=1705564 RepID=A0A150IUX4_9EURY|nr:MAG: gamma-glutamyl phosphate reductase [Candidatus Methanofastidiosum methylthiophilus]KYC48752.1 MAG: gamma-glutamyl phosphate reductase [Candidatus Methanofastidiosum methylthiophilus]KYC51400.1 MAG: gamma-glutamyl phosphate reductase [Candidatus Methanofastidiosum methylthiophilus]